MRLRHLSILQRISTYIGRLCIRFFSRAVHVYFARAVQFGIEVAEKFPILPLRNSEKFPILCIENTAGHKQFRDYADEFEYLTNSGVALAVKAISNPKFPLKESESKNLLKLYLSDVGLEQI